MLFGVDSAEKRKEPKAFAPDSKTNPLPN